VLVIGIAIALPACLHVLVQNVREASGDWGSALDISVYMKTSASLDDTRRTADRIRQRRDVDDVQIIKADDALKEFREGSGFGAALDALKENPLPHALVVRPDAEFRSPGQIRSLTEALQALPNVDIVQLDTAWVTAFQRDPRRRAARDPARGRALRAWHPRDRRQHDPARHREPARRDRGYEARRRQQRVRTEALPVQRLLVRLGGGVIAWLVVTVAVRILADPVQRIAGLYGSAFTLRGLGPAGGLALIVSAIVLGWLGSFIAGDPAAPRHRAALTCRVGGGSRGS
jgi:cell division transport system permease protein